jgi:amino-acid N-acetyltransferase
MATIRDALKEDSEYINSILRINGQSVDTEEEDYKGFIVAELDGNVVGCGKLINHGDKVEIRKVSVLPEYQRRGIGKEISRALLDRAKGRKCWLLSVDSHGFWEQFGFHILPEEEEPKEAKEYCQNCRLRQDCNRVVMFREEV